MASTATNPVRGGAAGLGIVSFLAGSDNRENTALACEMQWRLLARRFGLSADRARLIAALAYGEAR